MQSDTFSRLNATQQLITIYIILNANHQDGIWYDKYKDIEVEVKRGELVTSRSKIANEWFKGDKEVTEQKVRTTLKKLERFGFLTIESTKQYTLLKVLNYGLYQDSEKETNQEDNQETTKKKPRNNQEETTNKNVKNDKNDKEQIPYAEIIERLNEKAGKNFKHQANGNRKVIKARWEDGQRLEDFFTVIDYCSNEWAGKTFGNGEPGDRYLQPSTLFNGRFDERLNWANSKKQHDKPQSSGKTRAQIEHEQMLKENGLA